MIRRHSGGEYDRERPAFAVTGSADRQRTRDDGFFRSEDSERGYSRRNDYHVDAQERSRPPRAHRNVVEQWDRTPGSASKPSFEERGERERDLEAGGAPWGQSRRRGDDDESIDGYDYERYKKGHEHRHSRKLDFNTLSKEEKAEVLRLPWTQWMNSDVKNRMFLLSPSYFSLKIKTAH